MGHLSYEESKSKALTIIIILGVITIGEVLFALLGKGYLIDGFHLPLWFMGFVMIALSVAKAYLIIYEFMHMKYEVPGLVRSVLLPTALLIWATIAFFQEGNTWKRYRAERSAVDTRITVPGTPTLQEVKAELKKNKSSHGHHDSGHGHDDHGHDHHGHDHH